MMPVERYTTEYGRESRARMRARGKVVLNAWIPTTLRDDLLILAERDDRSLASYIRLVLSAHVTEAKARGDHL